jgi:hypothetical protein
VSELPARIVSNSDERGARRRVRRRTTLIDADTAGRMLEIGVAQSDGIDVIVHAMSQVSG